MKNKYNIEEIKHNKADSSRGFFVVCLATSKKIEFKL